MGLLPAGIGTPDARKRACPVRGALDGNLLSKGSKALSFDPGECITALFSEIDEQMRALPKHPEAHLWPSEVGTLGLLHALKGVGNRAFYRWLTRDYRALFPPLARADAALSSLHDPSGLDPGLLGCSDGARGHRHLGDRVDPSQARRPQP